MRAHGFETDIIYAGGRASDILIPEGMEHEACRGSHLLDALLLAGASGEEAREHVACRGPLGNGA